MTVYTSEIDCLKLMEGILNKLIEREIITVIEANKLIEEAKAQNGKR